MSGTEDDHFRRLLGIEKDIKLIDDVLELICRDFENIKRVTKTKKKFFYLIKKENDIIFFSLNNQEINVNIFFMNYKNVLNVVVQI